MNSKTKMISFRLSTEEYDRLRAACRTAGVTNVSELARAAMHQILDGNGNGNGNGTHPVLLDQVRILRRKVDLISTEIDRITRLLEQ